MHNRQSMHKVVVFLFLALLVSPLQEARAATKPVPSDPFITAVQDAVKINKLPKNLTPKITKARSDKSFWLDQECSVDFPDVKTPDCQAGDVNSSKIMVVYGDSHASMWMSALDPIAKAKKWHIYLFAKLACPIVEVPVWSYQLNKPFTECTQWQNLALQKIDALKPDLLITTDQFKPAVTDGVKDDYATSTLWQTEFPKALLHLKNIAKRVVVIGNNPSQQQDPATCASKPGASLILCASSRSAADNHQINAIESRAAKDLGITFIDPVPWSCTPFLCPIIVKNIFVYFDQWHFTATFVRYLQPALLASLKL